jgi:hypothetical protein
MINVEIYLYYLDSIFPFHWKQSLILNLTSNSNQQILSILYFILKKSEKKRIISNVLIHLVVGIALYRSESEWMLLNPTDELSKSPKAVYNLIKLKLN